MTSDLALLIQLENVSFTKPNFSGFNNSDNHNSGFENINWEVKPGETWVITGPVGAGKTTLAEAVMGKHRLQQGKISIYDPSDPENKRFLPRHKIAFLSFQPQSSKLNYNNFYLQQRYNNSESEDAITMQEFLATALPAAADSEKITETAWLIGISDCFTCKL